MRCVEMGQMSQKPWRLECAEGIGRPRAWDTGNYTFTFGDGSSALARYSFVYADEDGEWIIVRLHSSLAPEGE